MLCQQDAFDEVDCNCPIERQEYMADKVMDICRMEFEFEGFVEVSDFFKELINALRQMNYTLFQSEDFRAAEEKVNALVSQRAKN